MIKVEDKQKKQEVIEVDRAKTKNITKIDNDGTYHVLFISIHSAVHKHLIILRLSSKEFSCKIILRGM